MGHPGIERNLSRALLFDWGDTLMRVFPESEGPMCTWKVVEEMPRARIVLERLHPDWLIGLATNASDSTEFEIRAALERVGLSRWIDVVFCTKTAGVKKPVTTYFEVIADELSLAPSRMIMVGDNLEQDVLGAQRAGLQAIWIQPPSFERTDPVLHTVQNLLELLPLLETLGEELEA